MPTRKILVIDDSKVIRMRVKDMLPSGDFEILEAKDGAEGFDLICNENPNLIMLDFLLPKMSGWDVYQNIQKQPQLKSIPLMLMSGRKEEVTEKLPEPFENFSFVEKPFDQKQLVRGIKEAMAKAKNHAPTASATASPAGADLQVLNDRIRKMQGEIDSLKKQLNQVIGYVKQKLR